MTPIAEFWPRTKTFLVLSIAIRINAPRSIRSFSQTKIPGRPSGRLSVLLRDACLPNDLSYFITFCRTSATLFAFFPRFPRKKGVQRSRRVLRPIRLLRRPWRGFEMGSGWASMGLELGLNWLCSCRAGRRLNFHIHLYYKALRSFGLFEKLALF